MTDRSSAKSLQIPVINISPLVSRRADRTAVAAQIRQACRNTGFFYIVGHEIDELLQQRLEQLSQQFFCQEIASRAKLFGMRISSR